MARGSEVFEKGEMATVIRWISEVPGVGPSEQARDVSLLLGILMGIEGQAAGAEYLLGRVATNARSSSGRAGLRPSLPCRSGPMAPPPDISLDMAIRALDMLDHLGDDQLPNIMNLTYPASLETMAVLSVGGRTSKRAISSRLGTGSSGDWRPKEPPIHLEDQRPGLPGIARGLAGQHGTRGCIV
jgi:hypothetical protein